MPRIPTFLKEIDAKDSLFFIGLGLVSYGTWLQSPWMSFIVAGSVLMLLSIVAATKGKG